MTDPATGQRSLLQALRVPFDLKGVGAGALACLALAWGGRLITGEQDPWTALRAGAIFAEPLTSESGWWQEHSGEEFALLGLALAVAAVFGVACCRIAAMRIARDDGVDLSAALGFSVSGLGATLGAFLFMAAAMGFFAGCNALAGLCAGIPGVGPILLIVLFPLAILSSVVLFLLCFGTVLGTPLTLAALATERNGALDAVSRGFSYVFSRPALFFFYGATVWFLGTVLFMASLRIEGLVVGSLTHWLPEGKSWDALEEVLRSALASVRSLKMWDASDAEGVAVLGGWVAWLFGTLFHLALMGFVVYYFFGGATAAYFALRRDVDGTEDEEIWIAGEEGPGFGEPERPEPAPAASPSPPAPTAGGSA